MNKNRVEAELPPDMARWLAQHGSRATWEAVSRDTAVVTGQRLLVAGGESGWNRTLFAMLGADEHPAVRALAATLGCDPRARRWSAHRVSKALIVYFELWGAYEHVSRRLGSGNRHELASDAA